MRSWTIGIGIFFAVCAASCQGKPKQVQEKSQESKGASAPAQAVAKKGAIVQDAMLNLFKPALPKEFIAKDAPITEEKVALGRMLYFDKRLSKNHDVSCNTCHLLDKYGVDGLKTSKGHRDQLGTRNSPTVYNAAGHFVQFWDGRSPHVEHQATQPVMNPVEMAMADDKVVVKTLQSIPGYVEAFKKAFPEEKQAVSLENAGKAMGAFERRLVTPSKWDKFLNGDKTALNDAEKEGFVTFTNTGCMACHMGTLVGGTSYQKLGSVKPWPNQEDLGRYVETKAEGDQMMFKSPSLRNVTETAPYFHDGSIASLDEAVKLMGIHQLGREIPDKDIKSIVVWLKTLTGDLPMEYIKEPELPPSTANTPKPDPT